MIRSLRIKFIVITMATLLLVFASVFVTLNLFMNVRSTEQTKHTLAFVAEQDGLSYPLFDISKPPNEMDKMPTPSRETMRTGRLFYAKVDGNNSILEMRYDMIFDLSEKDVVGYVEKALQQSKATGTIENLQYLIADKVYGKILVFSERSIESRMLEQLIDVSLWVAGGSSLVLLLLTVLLSNWVVKPVQIAFDKQRRFVSDASHELKTPLTTISATVDVLDNEIGPNQRIDQVKRQTQGMSNLVHDLLSLAKTDEAQSPLVFGSFDLSRAILSTTLEFESRAFEEGKQLTYAIEEEIHLLADLEKTKQVAAILIDNAIVHSKECGEIKVTLKKQNNKISLAVYNTGEGILSEDFDKVFERFYRSDFSRSRDTGGYGLGLSIAKGIIDAHRWKVQIKGEAGKWIEFLVLM